MPRYYFSLTNGRPFEDRDGLELVDLAAAREEAGGFARDVMRREPQLHCPRDQRERAASLRPAVSGRQLKWPAGTQSKIFDCLCLITD